MTKYFSILISLLFLFSCRPEKQNQTLLFSKDNLVAWCIVPFDSMERTPLQRAQMLRDLGIKQLAYDWRIKHLETFPEEIKALRDHKIKLASVWMWIEPDSTGKLLDASNEQIIQTVRDNKIQTDFWIGFSNANFDGLSEEEKMNKAVSSVRQLHKRAREIGCTISLYNHGDWFGEPENQVRIIQNVNENDVGIVYNFHHAHSQVESFGKLLQEMLPYLRTVNLNGMKTDGPKILTLGAGDQELEMLKTLKASGYSGSLGIIGHIEDEDAKVVLARNIDGLRSLLERMDEQEALATYK
jgi:sugar phosphate isomerase/epimerase